MNNTLTLSQRKYLCAISVYLIVESSSFRLRARKKGRNCTATKDCRRSSNFAGLIFNNRKGREESQPRASTFSLPSSLLSPNRSGFCNSLPVNLPLVGDVIYDKGWHMHPYFATTLQPLTHCFRRSVETMKQPDSFSFHRRLLRWESKVDSKFTDISYATHCSPSRFAHRNRDEFPFDRRRALLRKRCGGYWSTICRAICATYDCHGLAGKSTCIGRGIITICHFEKSTENRTIIVLYCVARSIMHFWNKISRESDETILSPHSFRLLLIPHKIPHK